MKPRREREDMPLLGGVSEIASGLLERKKEGLSPLPENAETRHSGKPGATLALSAAFDCCCSIAATVPIFPLTVRLPID